MKTAGRILFGVVAGMTLAFALVVAIEVFSAVLHPMPANLIGGVPEHVRRYPHWILAVAALAWAATIAASTWVATRIGGRPAGIIMALLLASALIFNLTMLPYASWFKVAMSVALPITCLLGIKYGKRAR